MKRSELFARVLITGISLGAVLIPLAFWARTPLIHARVAESGGWSPDIIQAETGEPLHFHLISDDVVHGFAVGQMGVEAVDVSPGKVTDVTLTFDRPGTYTFYCTRWCGLNHWRMRGTIEVTGGSGSREAAPPPLYLALGLDIDAPHDSPVVPDQKPSAISGQRLASDLPISQFTGSDYLRTHSPYQLYQDLNATNLTSSQRWDVVAYLWQSNTTPEGLANGGRIYVQNCAACHGEGGAGDGIFADDLSAASNASTQKMAGTQGMTIQAPADFSDPERMLGASPALLQGKILRGGMGTGMPMWGSIFTEGQIWDVISYIYSFQFQYK